jgi:hypothetical protein
MESDSVPLRLWWAFVAWSLLLPAAPVAGASGLVVQQIGDGRGRIAQAVAEEAVAAGLTLVPFSPGLDARATSIILAPGKVFLARNGKRVLGLRPAERSALQQAYDAGRAILLLDASTHDIEALHVLLEDGVAHESSTDPVVLAYALRQENHIPTARLVTHPIEDDVGEDLDEDELDEAELALGQALEIVIEELTRPPAAPEDDTTASSTNWGDSPVQRTILELSDRGTYNTPVEIFALHSCQENMDYYLVNTGGTWTPERARYESADQRRGQMRVDSHGNLQVDWQAGELFCDGGGNVSGNGGPGHICRYIDYPLSYQVDIVPPSGPRVVQVNAAPAGDQGKSASYTSGFSFSIGGGVDVSGKGPSGGFQAGVTWDNSVSTTVPALAIQAGNKGNQGTFTRYRYCTVGSDANCTSTIQMATPFGPCQNWVVGQPQNGQTPNGRLSNVAQTVNWRVDPGTYTGLTFDITVTFEVELTTSTSYLWHGPLRNHLPPDRLRGPAGYCNPFGCSCGIHHTQSAHVRVSHTFKVPPPSRQCPSSDSDVASAKPVRNGAERF